MATLTPAIRSLSMVVALGLAGAAYSAGQAPPSPEPADTQASPPATSQSQPDETTQPSEATQPNESPDPQAASSPHQREVTSKDGTEAPPAASPDPQAAASPHQRGAVGETPNAGMAGAAPKLVGLEVQSPQGEPLGAVIDAVLDADRQPAYAVISTGTDTATAVPYASVAPMVKGGKVVMDRTRLQNSPQVAQSELNDKSNTKWRADADRYWSAGAVRSASPSNPSAPRER